MAKHNENNSTIVKAILEFDNGTKEEYDVSKEAGLVFMHTAYKPNKAEGTVTSSCIQVAGDSEILLHTIRHLGKGRDELIREIAH